MEFEAPRTRREKEVAALFAEALGVERAGMRGGFFDRGGDSVLAARLVGRIGEAPGAGMTVQEFLEEPAVEGVCRWIERPRERGGLDAAVAAG